jgi:hypothetical protein
MMGNMLLLGFSLLSWGWLSDTRWMAGLLFAVLTVCRSVPWRWTFSPMQFIRVGDLTTLLMIVLLVDVYIVQPVELPIFVLLKWLPALFAPIQVIQILSSQQQLPLATLFYSLRKPWLDSLSSKTDNGIDNVKAIDFTQPYACLTILAAGAANPQTPVYFVLAVVLFIGILWSVRPRHSAIPIWLANIGLAVFVSYHGYHRLYDLNSLVEEKSLQWLSHWQSDPFTGRTSIGDVGHLKLSDKIEFRLRAEEPLLLHQSSFDLYSGQFWIASNRQLFDQPQEVRDETANFKRLEIYQKMPAEALLALPDGTVSIQGLFMAELQYSAMGAVRVSLPPKFNRYQVLYDGRRTGSVGRYDLQIPKQHLDWLQQYSKKMQLAKQPPELIALNIKRYFQAHFFYSLYLGNDSDTDQALRNFMLDRHAGHCEYFAAATVFLLRYAGIPARLATGYSVSEYSPDEELYIVRSRHAHAWAIAYIGGVWRAVDSTPAQWFAMETDHASLWQPVSDIISNIAFSYRQWQLQPHRDDMTAIGLAISGLLVLYLLWRFFGVRARQQPQPTLTESHYQGLSSEFFLIERQLQNTPEARLPHESMQQWVKRLQIQELEDLFQLHYRLRFDPLELSQSQKQALHDRSMAWLAQFASSYRQ